jgi:exosortase D (VPLPA-CTERM-specific)
MSLLITLIFMMYWDVYADLIKVWNDKEEYSHGFMIPLVSGYFLWQKKSLLIAEKIQPCNYGFLAIAFALAAYFVGSVGDILFLLRFSFIFLVLGLILLFFGYKITKISLIPILLLIFSFPLPPDIQASLTAKLQLLSSQLGVSFIRICDIPVYLEGNVIDLGNYQLQVVEACSGLRYLFPLMGLSFICAYLYQVAFWKRAVVFLTSIPITIFMNSFRIGIIGVLVQYWGTSMAEGFIHDFEGWVVFMSCFAILFLEMWLLSWTERKTHSWEDVFGLITYQSTESVSENQYPKYLRWDHRLKRRLFPSRTSACRFPANNPPSANRLIQPARWLPNWKVGRRGSVQSHASGVVRRI